jgi:hypothetical protein
MLVQTLVIVRTWASVSGHTTACSVTNACACRISRTPQSSCTTIFGICNGVQRCAAGRASGGIDRTCTTCCTAYFKRAGRFCAFTLSRGTFRIQVAFESISITITVVIAAVTMITSPALQIAVNSTICAACRVRARFIR